MKTKTFEFFSQASVKSKIEELQSDLLLALDLQDEVMVEDIILKIRNYTKIYFMVD
jgi:hypothetical protein